MGYKNKSIAKLMSSQVEHFEKKEFGGYVVLHMMVFFFIDMLGILRESQWFIPAV